MARTPTSTAASSSFRTIRAFSRGFTLLEIAVVLFLMGLMLLIAMPYMGGYRQAQMKSEVRRLAGRAVYLYDEASSRKLVIRLVFDLDRNGYFVESADPYSMKPTFVSDRSTWGAPVQFPPAIRLNDVTVEGVGTFNRGQVAAQFYPQGYADATLLHIVDASGHVMTLGIDPLTGAVKIGAGNLSYRQLVEAR